MTEIPPLPGLVENVRTFRSPVDAVNARDHLIDAVERAHRATDEAERRSWLTFVVAGAGDTGVELAGALNSYIAGGLLHEYPWLAPANQEKAFRVVLVGRAPQLLPMSDPQEAAETRKALESVGVEIQTGTAVQEVRPDAVVTSRGTIPTRTVFWAAGISAPPLLHDLPVKRAKGGTLVVDEHLRLPDHPEVFVVGDSAWAFDSRGRALPPTAQAAEFAGHHAGEVLAAQIRGETHLPPFRYVPLGHLELIGPGMAIARIGPLLLTGPIAWLGWHAYYLYRIPSWKRRLSLLATWGISAVFGREVAQVRATRAGVERKASVPR